MKSVCADVVIDLQFGDCGKGKVVHCLAAERAYTHVMRFNGGSNAGHTIYHKGKKFVTHLVPTISITFWGGIPAFTAQDTLFITKEKSLLLI